MTGSEYDRARRSLTRLVRRAIASTQLVTVEYGRDPQGGRPVTKSAARRVNGAARKLAPRVCRAFGPRDLTLTYYDLGPYSIESARRLAGVEGLDVNLPYLAELPNRAARRGGV